MYENAPIDFPAPEVVDPSKIRTYSLLCGAGGGTFWDEVLEYRVWTHGEGGDGATIFDNYKQAREFAEREGTIVLALVLQRETCWGNDGSDMKMEFEERKAEWQIAWLREDNHRPTILLNVAIANIEAA